MVFPVAEPSGPMLRVVIAAYNEAANLEPLLDAVSGALGKAAIPHTVYVVDDGSDDGTAEVLKSVSARLPVRVLRHETNRGIAQVFLTGLRAAAAEGGDNDAVAVLEGDGTSDPALLPRMLEAMGAGNDVVVASRYRSGGGYRGFPLKRRILSSGANWMLRFLCPLKGVRDYTIFYRMYRAGPLKRALAAYGDEFTSAGGFACNAEMLLRLSPFVRGVTEVPFIYDYSLKRGASSMKVGNNLLSYVSLFRIYFFERVKE